MVICAGKSGSAPARRPRPGERRGRLLGRFGASATPSGREPPRSELPRSRSCPGHRRSQNKASDGEGENRTAQNVELRLPPATSPHCLRGGDTVSLRGRDESLSGLRQLHQMHPPGQVPVGNAHRSELLRTVQHRISRRYDSPELADVTAKTQHEFLHIADALRQRRVLVQHERHRLRRSRRPIALPARLGIDTALSALGTARACIPTGSQRQTHDTTPLHIRPTDFGLDWCDAWDGEQRGTPRCGDQGGSAWGAGAPRGVDH